jgi:hypothetical protein
VFRDGLKSFTDTFAYAGRCVGIGCGDGTTLLSLKMAVEKLVASPSQIASQISGAAGQTVAQPVAEKQSLECVKAIENKGEKSLSGAAWQILSKIEKWCALQVSNLRPLPCEGNALPLS